MKIKKDRSLAEEIFEEFWKSGPWLKVKKKQAHSRFEKTVLNLANLGDIQQARERYANHLRANPWKNPMMGSTFINCWEDWVNFIEPEKAPDTKNHIHNARCFESGCPFDPIRRVDDDEEVHSFKIKNDYADELDVAAIVQPDSPKGLEALGRARTKAWTAIAKEHLIRDKWREPFSEKGSDE
jgi:hypothetical protein